MHKKSLTLSVLVGVMALNITSVSAQTPCKSSPTVIHITSGPLQKTLADFSTQLGCPVQYNRRVVQSVRGNAVQGKLAPSEALIQLVQGTGLEAHYDNNKLSVSQADQLATKRTASALQVRLKQAASAQKVSLAASTAMQAELEQVKTSVVKLATQQGFVSAAEKASFQRTFARAEQLLAKS